MSAANPNPMENSMISVLVVANTGGGSPLLCGVSAILKVAVDTLMKTLDENITITTPPAPDTATSSTMMEEMTMQLSQVQDDIQDVLDAVRNPPAKRKRRTSNQDNEPTMPTNRRPATQRARDASPEHSLMHSWHTTSAAREALDALMIKYPLFVCLFIH
jgi:hypothetical protein